MAVITAQFQTLLDQIFAEQFNTLATLHIIICGCADLGELPALGDCPLWDAIKEHGDV